MAALPEERPQEKKRERGRIGFFRSFVFLRGIAVAGRLSATPRRAMVPAGRPQGPAAKQNRGGLKAPVVTGIAIGIIAVNWLDAAAGTIPGGSACSSASSALLPRFRSGFW